MVRQSIVVGLVIVGLMTGSVVDLGACGDKFLRAGRSTRQHRYAAAYPATILIYKPVDVNRRGLKEWQKTLERAGHTPRIVEHNSNLPIVLAASPYDLVFADYADAAVVRAATADIAAPPRVLPFLNKPTAEKAAAVKAEYVAVIDHSRMTVVQALEEIDRLMAIAATSARRQP